MPSPTWCGPLRMCATSASAESPTATRHAACLRLASWSASSSRSRPIAAESTCPVTANHGGTRSTLIRSPSRSWTIGTCTSRCSRPASAVRPAITVTTQGRLGGPSSVATAAAGRSPTATGAGGVAAARAAAGIGVGGRTGRWAPPGPPPGGGANSGRSVGKRMTSRIESTLASSITSRSMPMPSPPVGGMPYSRART